MKSSERKETTKIFELEPAEVVKAFVNFLKGQGKTVPEKAQFTIRAGEVLISTVTIFATSVEEIGDGLNGKK